MRDDLRALVSSLGRALVWAQCRKTRHQVTHALTYFAGALVAMPALIISVVRVLRDAA